MKANTVEVKPVPKSSRKTLFRALFRLKKYRHSIIAVLILAAAGVATQLAAPILAGRAIDAMVAGSLGVPEGVIFALSLYGTAAAINALCGWASQAVSVRICARAACDLRGEAVAKLKTLPLGYLDARQSGEIVSRITVDIETFSDGLLLFFTQFFSGIMTIFGTLGFMLATNLPVGLTVALVTPLSLFSASFISRRSYRFFRAQNDARGALFGYVTEFVEGADVVEAFAYESQAGARFDELDKLYSEASVKATFFSSLTNPVTRFVNGVVYAGVTLAGALTPGMTVGSLSCFLSYASQYTKPFNEISGVIAELQNAAACAARVFELLDAEDEPPESEDAKTLVPDGSVQFENVSFSYNPETPLIKSLSIDIKPGMRVAIVGPTGCGKTTLINLLLRFYDVGSGKIKASGEDIRSVTRRSLRRAFGMVPQDTWLIPGTIRENIAYGRPDATDEEIRAAAKAAFAESFIKRLPNGYDTVVGDDGAGLSAGQKQLLCIARVMLANPPMLILDEATSNIDTRTELKVQKAISELTKGRTSIIVAHRLSTIRDADLILVMRDGQIIERGKHEELLEKDGFYAKLYGSQFEKIG
ncbi:MAG TPA: ABC transporter ATP-binding protein [Clostridiales bacterium]|nr:ABC transporter ATP-binding protein [Clostridiales bacterium]